MRRALSLALSAAVALAYGHLPVSAADDTVEVDDNDFVPRTIEVVAGTRVVWTNVGVNPHSVTADDSSFDSNSGCSTAIESTPFCMLPTQEYALVFGTAGTFPYYCKVHGGAGGAGMSGVVVVTSNPDPGPPPPEQPPPSPPPPEDGGSEQEQVVQKDEQKLKKCKKKARKKAKKKKSKKKRKKAIKKCKKKFGRVG